MLQSDHAEKMTDRFRELVEEAGDELPAHHYDQLRLIIEAGLETALVEAMDKISDKLTQVAKDIHNDANFFE